MSSPQSCEEWTFAGEKLRRLERSACPSHRVDTRNLDFSLQTNSSVQSGKHRSHFRRICGLCFTKSSGQPTCLQSLQPVFNTSSVAATTTGSQPFASRPVQPLPAVSTQQYAKGYPRLFSVGEDRRLVEYDVPNSFEHTGERRKSEFNLHLQCLQSTCTMKLVATRLP